MQPAVHTTVAASAQSAKIRAAFIKWWANYVVKLHIMMIKKGLQDYVWEEREKSPKIDGWGLVVTRWPRRARPPKNRTAIAGPAHLLLKNGPMVWCRRCGLYSADKLLKLRLPCEPERVQRHRTHEARLEQLLSGRHPVTGKRLGPLERSWTGRLSQQDRDGRQCTADARPPSTDRGPQSDSYGMARPFLKPQDARAFAKADEWLQEFVRVVPSAGPPIKKKKSKYRCPFDSDAGFSE